MMANLSIDRSMFFGLIHDTEYLLQIYLQSNKELKDFRSILAHSKSVSQCYRNRSAVTFQAVITGGAIDVTTVGYTLGALLHDVLEDGMNPETGKSVTIELIKGELEFIFKDHIRELKASARSQYGVLNTDISDNYFQNYIFDRITDSCIETITALTRKKKETYKEYIERVASCGDNEIIRIKIIDVMDHFINYETLKPSLVPRYLDALKVLAAVTQ